MVNITREEKPYKVVYNDFIDFLQAKNIGRH